MNKVRMSLDQNQSFAGDAAADRLWVDSVEKVGSSFVVNAICFEDELARCGSRGRQRGHRDQLGHLTKVLSGCS
ncbi:MULTISPECIES: hypothetical protein, partial [unclassified Bradyrhizobium]|uniref:hypothetical protein n=2 Tax=Bradyrhizobium TaxID=374 RepID=UPI0028F007CC